MTSAPRVPRLPALPVPAGSIWPPLTGRETLAAALVDVRAPVERLPGEWYTVSATGWRLHAAAAYASFDDAHAALLRWSAIHSALAGLLSPRRCLVAVDDDGAFRLWQIVFLERSLWRTVGDALTAGDAEATTRAVAHAVDVCRGLDERWCQSPWSLPCTLETVGDEDGSFVSVLPLPERLTARPGSHHRLRILRQLRSLVGQTLGADAARFDRLWHDEGLAG